MARNIAIASSGMVTGVGLTAPATCAAIRAGITGFEETRFLDNGGMWILGSEVPLPEAPRGTERLIQMACSAVREALGAAAVLQTENTPLFLGIAEQSRPGRQPGLDSTILERVQERLKTRFHGESRVLPQGRMSGITSMQLARSAILDAGFPSCIVVGVDSLLSGPTLAGYESRHRLLTSQNSNGFIPGEAAAAVVLVKSDATTRLHLQGIGSGTEPAPIESGNPLRADGLVTAFKSALSDAGVSWELLDFRITDLNGEQYFFRETALALTRCLRVRKEEFDLWHAADCVGEVGAATVPVALGVALDAVSKGYAPGPGILCHFSCDGPERAAAVVRAA